MQTDGAFTTDNLAIPLARWADRQLCDLTAIAPSPRIAALNGTTLLGERGSAGRFTINGKTSAGIGASRLLPTRDGGWFALTVIRSEDREMLPALFFGQDVNISDDASIAAAVARCTCADLLSRGRDLGLTVASADETPASPPVEILADGPYRSRKPGHRPLVIDMSAIWAGPLAGHLLWLGGARVLKIESLSRPDLIRQHDPATFDVINQGKASVTVDLENDAQRSQLIALIRRADFVIESSRPRALKHLGIDADALVEQTPGLVWLTITGHGATGDAANWAGIGSDCSVAAGLSRALERASGTIGYVGDAIADPLTGITAALEGWKTFKAGKARRIGFSMSAITAQALSQEMARGPELLNAELRAWGAATGQPFPRLKRRELFAPVRPLGADTAQWMGQGAPC